MLTCVIRKRRVIAAALVFVSVAASLWALVVLPFGDAWHTYRNESFGYEIRYPPGWRVVDARDPLPDDDFLTQSITLRPMTAAALPRVTVAVNFQGDWCTTGKIEMANLVVSGVPGSRYDCDQDSDGHNDELVVFIRTGPEAVTWWIGGIWTQDHDARTVEKVVRSFRFRRGGKW
jgi:hypothetical protein